MGVRPLHRRLPAVRGRGRRGRRPAAGPPRPTGQAEDTVVVYTSDQGFFLGRARLVRQAVHVPRVPADAAAGPLPAAGRRRARSQRRAGAERGLRPDPPRAGRRRRPPADAGPFAAAAARGARPADVGWRTATYYRYWEHLDGIHRVAAHRGVRTRDRKLVHYYGSGLRPARRVRARSRAGVGALRPRRRPRGDALGARRPGVRRRPRPPARPCSTGSPSSSGTTLPPTPRTSPTRH